MNPVLLEGEALASAAANRWSFLITHSFLLKIPIFRFAPVNPVLLEGEALASAAANRSAAFYQTKQYIHAIDDIGELF